MVDCYIQKYWECEIGWHLSSNWMKKQNKTNMLKSVSIHFDCFTLNNGPYRRHKSLKTLHKYKANTAVMTYSTYLQPTWKNKSQLQIFIMNTYSMNNEILKSTGEVQSLRQKLILRQKITNIQIPWSLTLVHHREIIKNRTHEWKYWNSSIKKAWAQKSCRVLMDKSHRWMTYW